MSEPAQEGAITDVDKDRALSAFLDLVQIDSPTYEERPIMERIARELEELGLAVWNDRTGRDGAGNLHARLPGTRSDLAPLLLCAHTDTVEPGRRVTPVVRDGVVRTLRPVRSSKAGGVTAMRLSK